MSGIGPNTKLFSGNANPLLAENIAEYLNTHLSARELAKFSDGEIRCEITNTVRGYHVFIIQSTSAPVNDNLMELLVLADAFRRQGVSAITAVVPYYGYARQDRKPGLTRTPITSRLVADMMQLAGVTQVIFVDIHSEQQLGFFRIPIINIAAAPIIVADIWRNHYEPMIVSPDVGGVVRARAVAKQLDNADLAIVDKRRPEANVSEVMNIIGDVRDRECILIDDMIDTAGTLCKAAAALKGKGAKSVSAYATHAVFSGKALENIENSVLDEVVVTDTIHLVGNIPNKIRVVSVAGLLAETIRRITSHQSVSAIYTGS